MRRRRERKEGERLVMRRRAGRERGREEEGEREVVRRMGRKEGER